MNHSMLCLKDRILFLSLIASTGTSLEQRLFAKVSIPCIGFLAILSLRFHLILSSYCHEKATSF